MAHGRDGGTKKTTSYHNSGLSCVLILFTKDGNNGPIVYLGCSHLPRLFRRFPRGSRAAPGLHRLPQPDVEQPPPALVPLPVVLLQRAGDGRPRGPASALSSLSRPHLRRSALRRWALCRHGDNSRRGAGEATGEAATAGRGRDVSR